MGSKGSFYRNYLRMKKLKKLTINTEKVIMNEELVNLRGGYDTYEHSTKCYTNNGYMMVNTPSCSSSDVYAACKLVYGWTGASVCV